MVTVCQTACRVCFLLSFTHPFIHSALTCQVPALNDRPALPGTAWEQEGPGPAQCGSPSCVSARGEGRMTTLTHNDTRNSDEGMKLVGAVTRLQRQPPEEGESTIVKMPPPRAPPLFTLRCRAPPPAASWGSPISAGSVSCRTVPSPGQKKRWRLPAGKCQGCHWPLPRPPSKHHLPAPRPRREGSKEAFQFSTTGALRTAPQQAHTVLAPLLLTQLPKEEAVTAHGMK